MKNSIFIMIALCFCSLLYAQEKEQEREAKKYVREGNKLYNNLKFADAEIAYKKALSKKSNYPKATYNLANALYQQNRNKEALSEYELLAKTTKDKTMKYEVFHNAGNTLMNEKKYQESVEAYKNALRNNPKDEETRYNLALAQKMLKKQQQQNKDNKDNKNNKDKKNKDKQKDKKDKKDDKQKDKKQDKNDKKQENKKSEKDKKQPQKRPNQLSKQQMQQLLEAMNNEENKTQKKMNKKKEKGRKIKREKDW